MSTTPGTDPDTAPAFSSISNDDQAGWVIITSAVFLVFSFLAFGAKLLIAHFKPATSIFRGYDTFLGAATLFALVETTCIISACKKGLGRPKTTVNQSSFELVSKFSYTASILLVISQACSKTAVVLCLLALSPYKAILRLCYATLIVTVLWAVTAVIALAVQCHLPEPWVSNTGACIDQRPLHLYIGVVNIMTDVSLVLIPIYLMFLTRSEARYQVIALFSTRLLVPGFVIASYLALSSSLSSQSSDPTRDVVMPTVWAQMALNLSIITACIPGLKRVLDALRSEGSAISIAPPYHLSVSQNRYSLWLNSPIRSLKAWLSRNNPREERHRQGNHPPSIELQEPQLERHHSRPGTGGSVGRADSMSRTGTAEWSGSSTCLTSIAPGEWADYRARVISNERAGNMDSRNEETVKSSL